MNKLLAEVRAFAFSGSLLDVAIGISIAWPSRRSSTRWWSSSSRWWQRSPGSRPSTTCGTSARAACPVGAFLTDFLDFIPVDATVCMFCTRDVEPIVQERRN